MGVYHLMGLGRSPGTITGAFSYLAHRYGRWNSSDREFFGRSGEVEQREKGEKVGDVQCLILFTTAEVMNGKLKAFSYIDNGAGQNTGDDQPEDTMEKVLTKLLREEWRKLSKGRTEVDIFWVEVNRYDIRLTYERVAQVITALAGVGSQGKEIWGNLTGGTNVVNFAIQLAATLSGNVARLYYTQAPEANAEKFIRFSTEENYWIELPLMPLNLTPLSLAIIHHIEENPKIGFKALHSHLAGEYWRELQDKDLRQDFLSTLWKQGLIANDSDSYTIGPRWQPIEPYADFLEKIREDNRSLEQLSEESWITRQKLNLQ